MTSHEICDKSKTDSNQGTSFVFKNGQILPKSNGTLFLLSEDQVLKAEILHALRLANSNVLVQYFQTLK